MRSARLFGFAAPLACALTGAAFAGPLDDIYDEQELAALVPRYESGWRNNYDNVLGSVFTNEERSRLANVRFRIERRIPNHEPFAFMAGGNQVLVSAASIKFLEDISLAYNWLEMTGHAAQSVGDYLMMLRYWDARRGRPPQPLQALCIPPASSIDPKIVERATRAFDAAGLFVLLHEYGHVLHRHPGNAAVPPAVSRANEQAADRFALDVFARLRDVPIGVAILFFTMAHLHENRSDFGSDDDYRMSLAGRTHPVSPERLQAFARNLTEQADAYSKAFLRGAQMSAVKLALEVTTFAYLLADPGVQGLSARIGRTVRPFDLAPRPRGRHLSAPCDGRVTSGRAYDGTLRGKIFAGQTDFAIDLVLQQSGDEVSGSFSYGAGYGSMNGKVAGDALSYRWTLGPDSGRGAMTFRDGTYRGTWGNGQSATGGGTFELQKSP